MKATLVTALALLSLAFVPPRERELTGPAAPRDFADLDVLEVDRVRITRHLAAVERHLRAADVSHLTPAQRERRLEAIGHLREYRERGEYPHNHEFRERAPFFVDHRGVHCAMAYLIARSGDGGLVARVASSANNAYVRELAADPALRAWLERNGMTAAEAALVQPSYEGWPGDVSDPEPGPVAAYGVAGGVTLAADALALVLLTGQDRSSVVGGVMGALTGAVGAGLGGLVLVHGSDRTRELLAVANVLAGTATLGVSLHSLLRPAGGDDGGTTTDEASLELRPAFIDDDRLRPGVALALRF